MSRDLGAESSFQSQAPNPIVDVATEPYIYPVSNLSIRAVNVDMQSK